MSTRPSAMWHSPAAPGHREPPLVIAPKSEGGWSKVPGGFLGRGQFGEVWLARDHRSGREFAVKQVPCRGLQGPSQEIVDFQNEAELLMHLDHPHILRCFGVDRDEDYHYAFLELLDTSLSSCCHGDGGEPRPMEESTVRRYTRQMLLALEYLHPSIMHRDLKPRNVLLDRGSGCVKLADFGEAKQLRDGLAGLENTQGRGTPLYTPPEVLSSGQYDERVDIWCLGCTVIEMLTGELPWLERDPVTGAKTAPFLDSCGRPNLERMMLHIGEGGHTPAVPDSLSDKARGFLAYCFQLQPDRRPSATKLLSHLFVDEDDIEAFSTGEGAAHSTSGLRTETAPALDGVRFTTPTPQGAAVGVPPRAPSAAPPVWSPSQGPPPGPPPFPPKDTESRVSLLSGSWHSESESLLSSRASILPQTSPGRAGQGSWGGAAGMRGPGSPPSPVQGSLVGEAKTPRGVPAPSSSPRPLSPSILSASSASSRPPPSPQSRVRRSGPIIPLEKLGMGKLQGSVSAGAALQGSRPGSGSGRPQSPLEQGRVASEPGRAPSTARALPPRGPASASSGLFRRAQMGGLAPSRAPESFSDSDEDKGEDNSDEGEQEQEERQTEKREARGGTAPDIATSPSRSGHTRPHVASGALPSLSGDGSLRSGVAHSRALPPRSQPVQHFPLDGSGLGGGAGEAWSSGSMEGVPPGRGRMGVHSGSAAFWGQDLQESGARRWHPAADSPVGAAIAGLHAVSLDLRWAGPMENGPGSPGPEGMNSLRDGRPPVLARPLLPSGRTSPLLSPSPFPVGTSQQSRGGAGGVALSPGRYHEMHPSPQGQQVSERLAAAEPVPPPLPLLPFRSLPVPAHTLPSPGRSLAGAGEGGDQRTAGSASSTWASFTATGSASASSGRAVQGMPLRGQRTFLSSGAQPGDAGGHLPLQTSPRNGSQGVHSGGLPQDGHGSHTWGRPSSPGLAAATRGHSISSPEASLGQSPS